MHLTGDKLRIVETHLKEGSSLLSSLINAIKIKPLP